MPDPEPKKSLEIYREGVIMAFESSVSHVIDNGWSEHVAILFEQLFMRATDDVKVFCRNLSRKVFSEPKVLQAARMAIKNGVKIDVIVRETAESEEFLELLQGAGNVSIRMASERNKQERRSFAVVDDFAIRVDGIIGEPKAVINNKSVALAYIKAFTRVARTATVYGTI